MELKPVAATANADTELHRRRIHDIDLQRDRPHRRGSTTPPATR